MKKLLDDHVTYSVLPKDPTKDFKRALTEIVDEGFSLSILNKKERDYLIPLAPQIPTIYYLPKVHKNPVTPSRSPNHYHNRLGDL